MTAPASTLRPGDPPPFWEGLWHPQGLTEGAIMVHPLKAGESFSGSVAATAPATSAETLPLSAPPPADSIPLAAPPASESLPLTAPAPAESIPLAAPAASESIPLAAPAPASSIPLAAPTASENIPLAAPAPTDSLPMAASAAETIPLAAPAPTDSIPLAAPPAASGSESIPLGAPATTSAPTSASRTVPAASEPPAKPRSFVSSLLAQGPLAPLTGPVPPLDAAGAQALAAKAKELVAAKQMGPALQALNEALKRAPGEPALYAQLGSLLQAGRAFEDAAHHFMIAALLAPKEASYGRLALSSVFALGYVGWAYQLAQTLYKVQAAPDLAEYGRLGQAYLSRKAAAHAGVCLKCRTPSLTSAPAPCARCGGAPLSHPAHPTSLQGVRLLRQGPQGRLFLGAACRACGKGTPLLVSPNGPRCLACQGAPLPAL